MVTESIISVSCLYKGKLFTDENVNAFVMGHQMKEFCLSNYFCCLNEKLCHDIIYCGTLPDIDDTIRE